jgi:Lon-like protease
VSSPPARVVGALSRRVRTLIVSGVLFLVLLILTLTLPVPYVILSPGPTCNTLGTDADCNGPGDPVIVISGAPDQKRSGHLNLTTVGVTPKDAKLTVFDALSAWLQSDRSVVPTSSVYPPGQSEQQVNQQNTADFSASQNDAVQAAACELNYPRGFGVASVTDKSPSQDKLRPGDAFVSVAGSPAMTYPQLKAILESKQPGTSVPVIVSRGGTKVTEQITLGPPPKGAKGASLGITVITGCLTPYTVQLGLGDEIGGPSAGLMFALGIIDKVGKADLTGGKFIAGTGTISTDGKVGAIGGIQLKMIAARDKGATVFLAPADNCSDVQGATPDGLQVIKVSTLHDAVQDLEKLTKNEPVPGCQ